MMGSARLRRFFPATSLVVCAFAATPGCVSGDDAGGPMQVLRPLKVNPAVRLPEQEEGFSEVEVHDDSLIFFHPGAASAPLTAGDVIAGSKDGGYLRRVLSTEVLPDGRLRVATEHAYLTDYLTSGRFRIAHDPTDLPDGLEEAQSALKVAFDLLPPEQKWGCGVDGVDVFPILSFTLSKSVIEVDVEGELRGAAFEIKGTLEVGVGAQILGEVKANCQLDFVEMLKGKGLLIPELEVPLAIGTIPATLSAAPISSLSVDIEASTPGLSTSLTERYEVRLGATYRDGVWESAWVQPEHSTNLNLTMTRGADEPTVMKLDLQTGFTTKLKLFDLVGFAGSLVGDVRGVAVVNPDECEWSAGAYLGGRVSVGGIVEASLPFFAASVDVAKQEWDINGSYYGPRRGPIPFCSCPEGWDTIQCASRRVCAPEGSVCCGEWATHPDSGHECCSQDEIWNAGHTQIGGVCEPGKTCVQPLVFGACAGGALQCCKPGEPLSDWCCGKED